MTSSDAYSPLHKPQYATVVSPLGTALDLARDALAERATANIYDPQAMIAAAVELEMRLRGLVASLDKGSELATAPAVSTSADPLRVVTSDGAVWVRAAVTRAGLGLYCPEGVTACPRFVMATLLELAEHGVKVAPPVIDLPSAVALMGALPMPVGAATESDPVIVSRFDVAIEPAPEEDPVLIVGAVADDGRPVALLLDEETRARVGRWLVPEVEAPSAATCRCDEPDADPYECEADDCTAEFSELNPFGSGARPVDGASAEVSRKCGTCGWTTSVWHVDDGSADQELHEHTARAHPPVKTSADPRRAASVSKLRALLSRQTGGAST